MIYSFVALNRSAGIIILCTRIKKRDRFMTKIFMAFEMSGKRKYRLRIVCRSFNRHRRVAYPGRLFIFRSQD